MKSLLQIALMAAVGVSAIAPGSSGRESALQGVKVPTLIRFVAPKYPSSANSAVQNENIIAVVIVNADGTVREVTIKNAAGSPMENEVIKAVRKWSYVPAMKGGTPVACKISIPFSFDSQSGELVVDLGHYGGE